jgi:hypothetical protein
MYGVSLEGLEYAGMKFYFFSFTIGGEDYRLEGPPERHVTGTVILSTLSFGLTFF